MLLMKHYKIKDMSETVDELQSKLDEVKSLECQHLTKEEELEHIAEIMKDLNRWEYSKKQNVEFLRGRMTDYKFIGIMQPELLYDVLLNMLPEVEK